MNFLDELTHRQLIQDVTPGLDEHLASGKPVTAYIGFDPTAPSLTIGNYVPIMLLKFFQLSGHQPIMLFGGATGRIGDPSGKSAERTLKSNDEIEANLAAQKAQAMALLKPEPGMKDVIFVDNFEFYKNFSVLDFLRDVGKTLTVNYMMSKDSVKNRLETGLSFTEFSYQLLQGYDFQCLYKDHGCTLQMGGSDQWGNITSGSEFVRRNLQGKAFGLTTPLLTKADGTKFGKSEAGNIWMDAERTSPYQFFQFWINADDRDLGRYIRTFSLLGREAFDALLTQSVDDPRVAKVALAEELTARVHGAEALENAAAVSEMMFNRKASNEQLKGLKVEALAMIAEEIPSATVSASLFEGEGVLLSDLLSDHTSAVASKSEAKRAIKGNAVSVNKQKVSDENAVVSSSDFLQGKYIMLENGKKNKLMVVVG
ncbi:MAG: tyrosine--tRNA ligase [Saprospiraceae bacterium]